MSCVHEVSFVATKRQRALKATLITARLWMNDTGPIRTLNPSQLSTIQSLYPPPPPVTHQANTGAPPLQPTATFATSAQASTQTTWPPISTLRHERSAYSGGSNRLGGPENPRRLRRNPQTYRLIDAKLLDQLQILLDSRGAPPKMIRAVKGSRDGKG